MNFNEGVVVGVDIDGVLADLHTEWYSRYNKDWHDHLKSEDVRSWDTHLYVDPRCGKCIYSYLSQPDLYDAIQPIEGALAGVETLRADGYKVVFISSVVRGQTDAKWDWLVRHGFLDAPRGAGGDPAFITAHEKGLIRADVMIDDAPHNLTAFGRRGVLFNYPHNKAAEGLFFRVDGWSEVPAVVQYLRDKHVVSRGGYHER